MGAWCTGGIVVAVVVSSVLFAFVHFSTDLLLNVNYLFFAVGTALVTWRTGGIEIAVVLHAGINTLASCSTLRFTSTSSPRTTARRRRDDDDAAARRRRRPHDSGGVAAHPAHRTGPNTLPAQPGRRGHPARTGTDTPLGRAAATEETGARII
ncbi:CPBP family intramembrane glutamic endopeptidase [Oerskovia sp. M15]